MGFGKEVDMIAPGPANWTCSPAPTSSTPEEADGDGQGRRRRAHPAHGADDQGQHRREDGADAGGGREARAGPADAAKKVKPDILVLCHGGPISEPDDVQYILDHTKGIVGFFGASSIERLPTEVAITGCVREFKGLGLRS